MRDDPDPLTALSQLRQVRRELDRRERRLIEDSRALGASWADIAVALGLRSRQAAEQRWLRLCGEATRDPSRARVARQNQRAVDASYGAPIARLRAAAQTAYRQIEDDSVWDQRHPRAVLIEMSLRSAVDAAPGALFELVTQAEADLEQLSWRGLPAQLATALRDLRRAFAAAAEAR
jgi:hypothetical protein